MSSPKTLPHRLFAVSSSHGENQELGRTKNIPIPRLDHQARIRRNKSSPGQIRTLLLPKHLSIDQSSVVCLFEMWHIRTAAYNKRLLENSF
jgi:hypothetical protein